MKKGSSINSILAIISLVCSIASFFVLGYILATISFVLSMITIKDEHVKNIAIVSLIIVCIAFVLALLKNVIAGGYLPTWLTNGLI